MGRAEVIGDTNRSSKYLSQCEMDIFDKLEKKATQTMSIGCRKFGYRINFELGSAAVFGTAAYWVYQWHSGPFVSRPSGRSLWEETLYCMLGGYGITGELSNAYYEKIRSVYGPKDLLASEHLENLLCDPVIINGRKIRYRYPKMKAEYISGAMARLPEIEDATLNDLDLRNVLMTIPGIGYKTASWIVRNFRASECVAIIDIHLHRAGVAAGFFKGSWRPAQHYKMMEDAFLKFSEKFEVSAAGLDLLIWNHMRIRGLPAVYRNI